MKGVLLAAGKGNRLKPLTDHTPKPLLPVGGKPILQRIIEGLADAGIDQLAIIVGHLSEMMVDYFGDGSRYGVSIRYFQQTVCDGTAHAVLPAAEFLDKEPFFLGYGDILVDPLNYTGIRHEFERYPEDSVITGWASDTPWAGGVLIQKGERLTGLVEKPPKGTEPGRLINAGLMILQPEVIDHIRQVTPSPRGEYELTDALLTLARTSIVRVHEIRSFWSDIGTHDKLSQADAYFTRITSNTEIRRVHLQMDRTNNDAAPLKPKPRPRTSSILPSKAAVTSANELKTAAG